MFEQLEKMTLKEILRYAIASEDAAANYYRSLAKFLKSNELVNHKFEFLALEEEMHKKALNFLYKSMFGEEKYKEIYGVKGYRFPAGLPPLEGAIKVSSVGSLVEALDIAMLSEDQACNVYKFLARKFKDHRPLFERLAVLEQGHYAFLKGEKQLCEGVLMEDPSMAKKPVGRYANYFGKLAP